MRGDDFVFEPSPHLGAGIAHRQEFCPLAVINLVAKRNAAAVIEPSILFASSEAKGHARDKIESGSCACPQ